MSNNNLIILVLLVVVLFCSCTVATTASSPIQIVQQQQKQTVSRHLWATNPSFKVSLPQFAISYIVSTAVPVLERKLQSLPIPDVSTEVDSPLGKIAFSLTNIHLNSMKLGTDTMTIVGNGLQWNMMGTLSEI